MARVTLAQAVQHLALPIVLDTDPPDPRQADLALKLLAAEAIIVDYLKIPPVINPLAPAPAPRDTVLPPDWTTWPPVDPPAPVTPPRGQIPEDDPIVQAAILLELAELWRFRGDDQRHEGPDRPDHDTEQGQLSHIITNILRRYRDPALA
jgi:hypothetical protein